MAETVTVTCTRHRRHCTVHPGRRGQGVIIYHAEGPGDLLCDSQQFTVRREYSAGRRGAHAELIAREMNREAARRARENSSGTAAGKRED